MLRAAGLNVAPSDDHATHAASRLTVRKGGGPADCTCSIWSWPSVRFWMVIMDNTASGAGLLRLCPEPWTAPVPCPEAWRCLSHPEPSRDICNMVTITLRFQPCGVASLLRRAEPRSGSEAPASAPAPPFTAKRL